MNRLNSLVYGALLTVLALGLRVVPLPAQTVLDSADALKSIRIQNLQASPSMVTGVVANHSPHEIREIEILVQYHWLWANEFKPGDQPPGRAAFIKLDKALEPGQSMEFRYEPTPPLTARKDGRFAPEVSIAGFTVVVPGS